MALARSLVLGLLLAAIVVLVILVVASAGGSARDRYLCALGGVWSGDPSFLREAQASDFMVFIGPRGPGSEHQGYLRIVGDDGAVVASQAFTLTVRRPGRWRALRAALSSQPGGDVVSIRAAVEFDELAGPAPLPKEVTFSLSPLDGTLAILDQKKVYAFLVRDVYSSSVSLQAYSQPAA